MTTKELLENLLAGKKMRLPDWEKDYYIFINKDGSLARHDGNTPAALYTIDTDWQEYKEEILDKEEKEYLEAVLRPFKDRVKYISKVKSCLKNEYLYFSFDNYWFCLPEFKPNSMYKGMEVDKKYTLKDLGLFDRKIF